MSPDALSALLVALLASLAGVGTRVAVLSGKTGRQLRAARSLAGAEADYIYDCRRAMSAAGITPPPYPDRIKTYLDPKVADPKLDEDDTDMDPVR